MRYFLVLLCLLSVVMIGCTTKYTLTPEDRALFEDSLKAAQDARSSAEKAEAAVGNVSREAHGAMESADRAETAAEIAERSANRAEQAADRAETAAEKAVRAFEMRQTK